jgi:hypothetical protein
LHTRNVYETRKKNKLADYEALLNLSKKDRQELEEIKRQELAHESIIAFVEITHQEGDGRGVPDATKLKKLTDEVHAWEEYCSLFESNHL